MESEYKAHRKAVLADMTVAKIPEYYESALRFGRISEHHKKMDEIDKQIEEHRKAINDLYDEYNKVKRELNNSDPQTTRKFVMQCQNSGCRGMLSTRYKCEVCDKYTCAKCFVVKQNETHECNPNDVATADEIRNSSRPCPNCGCRISKIDGCFGAGVKVLLWSGKTKLSQDIAVGDILVGDDGTQRTVESLVSGEDALYWVHQRPTGERYTVSSKHKLVLYYFGQILDMEVDKYLKEGYKEDYLGIRRLFNEKVLTEITVTPAGRGNYYGWTVSGSNKRFLLADNTVVHNCDQMWCVECKTAFSWSKGTIETGMVHNPHYYQWMRQNGGAIQNPNEHNNMCRDDFQLAMRRINKLINIYMKAYDIELICNPNVEISTHCHISNFNYYFSRFHRYITHVENVILNQLNITIRTRETDHISVYLYILNRIDKNKMADRLIELDSANMKDIAHRDIVEALVVVGKQIMIDCMHELDMITDNNIIVTDIVSYSTSIYNVFVKYKKAIIDYCAYSQIETIKFLITYGSKRTVCSWNLEDGGIDNMQYKNKTEMMEDIQRIQNIMTANRET